MAAKKLMSVLGAGESGVGAAVLAQKKGYDVYVSDSGAIKPKYKEMLEHYGLKYDEGKHNEELILSSAEVVKSPGIPKEAPIVRKIEEKGIDKAIKSYKKEKDNLKTYKNFEEFEKDL